MRTYLQTGLVVLAGVLGGASATAEMDRNAAPIQKKPDFRVAIVRKFFQTKSSPAEAYADTFVIEADNHHLDWRLLPSLAFVESGGGKQSHLNNLFGWDNGDSGFSSAREGIHRVAEALAEARPYKGKSLQGKLFAYNPNPGYHSLVTGVMRQISHVIEPKGL